MKIAMLAPISWRTPPRHYGPWELVTSLLTEALVARGIDVTLFATQDVDEMLQHRVRAVRAVDVLQVFEGGFTHSGILLREFLFQ